MHDSLAAPGDVPLTGPYLLVLFSVPVFFDPQGRPHVDALWAQDLHAHRTYLPDLTVCSYRAPWPRDDTGLVPLDGVPGLRMVTLPRPRGLLHALARAPLTAALLWKEIGRCRIVHSSVAAWPLPEAWFTTPIARWRGRPQVINVESAFWRLPARDPAAPRWRRAWSRLQERLARACLDRCDLPLFTHDGYRRSLLSQPERGHVIPATWLQRDWVIDADALAGMLLAKAGRDRLHIGFCGRLTAAKGVLDAMQACADAVASGASLRFDLWGDGPLRDALARHPLVTSGQARLCGTEAYGPPLLARLRDFDLLLVPTTSDEQPRVVFDAYAQGVPVLASDSPGHRAVVRPGVTGELFPPGDVAALRAALVQAAENRAAWHARGTACRETALAHTHEAMHAARRRLLARL